MARNSLYLAYLHKRFFEEIPFKLQNYPLDTIMIPLEKVFFSYKNKDLKANFIDDINYLFYQIEVRGNDSIGVHFGLDFENTIVEVTDNSVFVWAGAPVYITDKNSNLSKQANNFSDLTTMLSTTTPGDKLTPVEDSGAAHTISGGQGLSAFSPERLLK